jgi:hypothetical protein
MTKAFIEVRGLDEIITRMQQYPQKLDSNVAATMWKAFDTIEIPPYPPETPDQTYIRTETLGRGLGSGFGGGWEKQMDIMEVKQLGPGDWTGTLGTKVPYAPYVVGEGTQAAVHQGRWWTLQGITRKAADKMSKVWQEMADKLAKWLDGKGL